MDYVGFWAVILESKIRVQTYPTHPVGVYLATLAQDSKLHRLTDRNTSLCADEPRLQVDYLDENHTFAVSIKP